MFGLLNFCFILFGGKKKKDLTVDSCEPLVLFLSSLELLGSLKNGRYKINITRLLLMTITAAMTLNPITGNKNLMILQRSHPNAEQHMNFAWRLHYATHSHPPLQTYTFMPLSYDWCRRDGTGHRMCYRPDVLTHTHLYWLKKKSISALTVALELNWSTLMCCATFCHVKLLCKSALNEPY